MQALYFENTPLLKRT